MKKSAFLNRRKFVKIGSHLMVLPLASPLLTACAPLLKSNPIDWANQIQQNDHKGEITIQEIEGEAQVAGMRVTKGLVLQNQKTIELKSGTLVAALPDGSVIKLSQQTVMTADFDSQKGGILTLKKGGILAVMRESRLKPYLIRNATALVGVKGTVFYTQVLSDKDKLESDIPEDASDYFCICNGSIDYLNSNWELQKSSKGVHHNAYFLKPGKDTIDFEYAGWLLNHSDSEILQLIDTMKGEKHSTQWLKTSNY